MTPEELEGLDQRAVARNTITGGATSKLIFLQILLWEIPSNKECMCAHMMFFRNIYYLQKQTI